MKSIQPQMGVVKLSRIDRKLLYELDMNARAPLSQLSKKIGVSKERVHYRIKRLEEAGVIVGYRTIINTNRLGHSYFRIYIKLRNTTLTIEQEIIAFLVENSRVGWCVTVEGSFDINLSLYVKDASDLTLFLYGLEQKYKHYLERVWVSIFYKIIQYPKNFLIDKKREVHDGLMFVSPAKAIEYDSMDMAILRSLAPNGKSTLLAIAACVGMSAKQTGQRIRELERNQVILGYRAIINHARIGYAYYKLLIWLKDWSAPGVQRIYAFARMHPHIFYTDEMLNGADVELEFLTEGKEQMHTIVEEFRIQFAEEIADYELQEYQHEHKLVFLPSDDERKEEKKKRKGG